MFVSEYTTYIQPRPLERTEKTSPTPFRNGKENFADTFDTFTHFHTTQTSKKILPYDYRRSNNYYANRYKLLQNRQPEELQRFHTLNRQIKLQPAYNIVFTSFYDLARPKKALMREISYKNTVFDRSKKASDKQVMLNTYITNDTYYKRAYAS